MRKKVVSGVLALLMVASAMPMSEISQIIPDISISASAVDYKETGELILGGAKFKFNYVKIDSEGTKKYLQLSPVDEKQYWFSNVAEITINTDDIFNALNNANAGTSGTVLYTELNYRFNNIRYGNDIYYSRLARVKFKGKKHIKIGDSMFAGINNLQTVDFGGVVDYIGDSAFNNCPNFKGASGSGNVMNLEGVKEIGNSAFSNCKTVTGFKLNGSLTFIGKNAFSNCTGVKSYDIPSTVWGIGAGAFSGSTSLEKVNFKSGSKLTALGDGAFQNCTRLTKVYYAGNTTKNTLPPNLAGDPDNLENEPSHKTGEQTFKWLGKGLFAGCTALQSFVIPKNIIAVPHTMFQGCTALQKVTFETGNKAACKFIGNGAFQQCTSLVQIELPDKCTKIYNAAFNLCTKLKKVIVSDNLNFFGAACYAEADGADSDEKLCGFNCGTFASCPVLSLAPRSKASSLKSNQIIIPPKVTYIPTTCFQSCTGITSVSMASVKDIGDKAFNNCRSLTSVTVPNAVSTIKSGVFQDCAGLKTVVYSKNLQEIKESAFKGCSSLTSARPSDQKAMKNTIMLPASCEAVQKFGFEDCSSFKYLNILSKTKSKLATLGEKAFANCTSLEGSTLDGTSSQELSFPSKVEVIHPRLFYKCNSLKTVKFEGKVTSIGESTFEECSSLTKVTINDTVKQIGANAFKNCTSLKNLPVTTKGKVAMTLVSEIKDGTFQGCKALKTADLSAAKNISSVGSHAFEDCAALTKVILPNASNLTNLGESAFNKCTALNLVTISATATNSRLPSSIVSVGKTAFANTALKNMTIVKPKNKDFQNIIGEGAFTDCKKLKSVDLSGSNLISLEKNLFANDELLTSVKLPTTLDTIGDSAFKNCVKLSTINSTTKGTAVIPKNVKTISNLAFADCHCIAKMTIPAATDNISMSAWNFSFTYTQDDLKKGVINPLKAIVIDSKNANYKSINGVMYSKDGSKLLMYPVMKQGKNFTVPSSVTEIGAGAFSSNNYIANVTIPTSVKTISSKAFNRCEGLRTVKYGNNKTVNFTYDAFSGLTGKPKVAFYASSGSTAQTYAESNSSYIAFVDNNKMVSKITFEEGQMLFICRTSGRYTLNPLLTTKNGQKTTDVLEFTSSNTDVALVDNEGNITPRKSGKAVVTVKTASGVSATITVNVGEERERLAGATREGTAVEISKKAFAKANTVIITTGYDFHDSLVSVPLAKAYNAPILTVQKGKVLPETLKEIKRLGAKNVILVNTKGSVDSSVTKTLTKNGLKVTTIGAGNYIDTAVAVAKKLQAKTGKAPKAVFFTTDKGYADALSASPVAAILGAPIIYVKTDAALSSATKKYLNSIKGSVKNVYVIGGPAAVSDKVWVDIKKTLDNASAVRFSGTDRYETCTKLNSYFAEQNVLKSDAICIAKGKNFPDALAGGVLAAMMKAPLFLGDQIVIDPKAKKYDLYWYQKDYLAKKKAKQLVIFGGQVAVPDDLVNMIRNAGY